MITVAIPVGSNKWNTDYLQEAIDSVLPQLEASDELLIVDDGANIVESQFPRATVHRNSWRLGDAMSHNVCIGVAIGEYVVWLASDDKLLPGCMDAIRRAIAEAPNKGWYWLDVVYSDGTTQAIAAGPACIRKEFWRQTGGYMPEMSVGCCDSEFISAMIEKNQDVFHRVVTPTPLYWHRLHGRWSAPYDGAEYIIRGVISKTWKPQPWTR